MGCHFYDYIIEDFNFHLASRLFLAGHDEVSDHAGSPMCQGLKVGQQAAVS